MEIDYKDFKEDCSSIIGSFLKMYRYDYDSKKSEAYVNYYFNGDYYIGISMIANFPNIDVSWGFFTSDLKLIRQSLIEKKLNINRKEKIDFYTNFKSENNLNDYSSQMRYAVAVMEHFYKPILIGKIKLDDIIK